MPSDIGSVLSRGNPPRDPAVVDMEDLARTELDKLAPSSSGRSVVVMNGDVLSTSLVVSVTGDW